MADARHHADGEQEHHGEAQPPGQRGHAQRALPRVRPAYGLEPDREQQQEGDEKAEEHRRPRQQLRPAPHAEEPDADAEEARQEDQVRQERHVDVVGADPSDQGKLEEQHDEAECPEPKSQLGSFGQGRDYRTSVLRPTKRPWPGSASAGSPSRATTCPRLSVSAGQPVIAMPS